ncbi:hypothetical protein [Leptolyngbya ohadii]|uniref:hypothetical protein n=1 Tax=Leptolyngbya ohadii TaxID=1962290 RepID=UPI000B599D25|nr:hypothetical protein [Leptolyngbya ohadii]
MSFPHYAIDVDIDLDESMLQGDLSASEPECDLDVEDWLEALADEEEVLRLSQLVEQEEWQERLQQQPSPLSRCCVTCRYLNRNHNPAIVCAVCPAGAGVGITEPNICRDWEPVDLTIALEVLEQSLATHSTSRGRSWRIVRVAYRWEWVMHAIVQVEGSVYKWQVWQNGNLDHPIAPYWSAEYGGECWKNVGATEQFVVWINEL